MKFTTALITSALLFSGFAAARPSRLADRVAARARKTRPMIRADGSILTAQATNTTHPTEFSSNWSGAVLLNPPSGQTFTTVVGTFTVPTPRGEGAASAWVGIDGDTAQNAILQSGVDFIVTNGRVSYDSWFEWFPNFAFDFSNFPVSAGNVITITVHSTSSTTGTVTLLNQSTGRSVSQSLTAPSSSASLQGRNAEWIVEDFEENGGLVELTNWGTVTFTGASASTGSSSVGLTGATIIDMEQNGQVLTNVVINSGSSVQISHV